MGFFDFSDWGTADWQEDRDAAISQAKEWTATTATAKAWPSTWSDYGIQVIDRSTDGSGDTAAQFWEELVSDWGTAAGADRPDGWDQLGATFSSATDATYTAAAARDLGSVSSIAMGTIEASVSDPKTKWLAAGAAVVALARVLR